ncbi:hypothetical protein JCM19314_1436 [Nonlabens ulvanivorans]|uniref:Uncharacterized protein n=1 Tax=Nonlabens ulvanivorans TaxID=906888 RepID=A0A090R1U8_NONUL|nr:hypothetical protein JCM19314_1436 [Nonlabens ulvanivorans]
MTFLEDAIVLFQTNGKSKQQQPKCLIKYFILICEVFNDLAFAKRNYHDLYNINYNNDK